MRALLWGGLAAAPVIPAVLLAALLQWQPGLVWNFLVPKVPFYFRFVRWLELADASQPSSHSLLFAPGYRRCFAAKVASAEGNCGGAGCGLVFVGDSILEDLTGTQCYWGGLGPYKAAAFKRAVPAEWRPLVLAGGSDQTQHTLRQLAAALPVLKSPKAFFVMIGTNNVGFSAVSIHGAGGQQRSQIVGGVLAVVAAVREAHPKSLVMLHPLLPRTDDFGSKGFQGLIDEINAELKAFAEAAGPQVKFVDCSKVFPRGYGGQARALMPDLLHPSPEGYNRWLACLRPSFEAAVGVAAA